MTADNDRAAHTPRLEAYSAIMLAITEAGGLQSWDELVRRAMQYGRSQRVTRPEVELALSTPIEEILWYLEGT